jgi:hypothetical protein
MGLNRYAKKRDANEAEIVAALREAGFWVALIDQPVDLLVGHTGYPTVVLMEVKVLDGALNASQTLWWRLSEGAHRFVIRTKAEALRAAKFWIKGEAEEPCATN